MATYLTSGIVLKKDVYREIDEQYTIFTPEHGKILAVVKSAKKITSKLHPHLELFVKVDLMLANGAQVDRVASVQGDTHFRFISQEINKILIANYFLEVVDKLTKYKFPDPEIFVILDGFLQLLNQKSAFREDLIILNRFLFDLLSHLGYQSEIKAKSQKQLLLALNGQVMEVVERPINSFNLLLRFFNSEAL
ncbi:MAG: DNA repair protein RecO [bacterium]